MLRLAATDLAPAVAPRPKLPEISEQSALRSATLDWQQHPRETYLWVAPCFALLAGRVA